MAPAAIDHVVHECLEKNPEARWQNAADLGRQLRWIASSSSAAMPVPAIRSATPLGRARVMGKRPSRCCLVSLIWFRVQSPHFAGSNLAVVLPPPPELAFDFTGDFSGPPAITPDGTAIAFCARNQKQRTPSGCSRLATWRQEKSKGPRGPLFLSGRPTEVRRVLCRRAPQEGANCRRTGDGFSGCGKLTRWNLEPG